MRGGGLSTAGGDACCIAAGRPTATISRKERAPPDTESPEWVGDGLVSLQQSVFDLPVGWNGSTRGDRGEGEPGVAGVGLVAFTAREVAAGAMAALGGRQGGGAPPGVGETRGSAIIYINGSSFLRSRTN